jgi:pSer/pThr/pTyr-binding forkhead associated (FHA) protein
MLILVNQKNSAHAIPVEATPFLIGKDDACHLRIADPSVSSLHAGIVERDGSFFLFDLQSRNKTFTVAREKAGVAPELRPVSSVEDIGNVTDADWQQATELRPGMQIAFAGVMWNCRDDQAIAEDVRPADQQSKSETEAEVELEELVGSEPGRILTIKLFPCVIGRSAAKSDIAFENDSSVSRAHARLYFDEKGRLCLEDMESRNGTFLNGRAIGSGIAHPAKGDRIQLSKELILGVCSGPAGTRLHRVVLLAAAAALAMLVLLLSFSRRTVTGGDPPMRPDADPVPDAGNTSQPREGAKDEPMSAVAPLATQNQNMPPAPTPAIAARETTNTDPVKARHITGLDLIVQEKFTEALVVARSVDDASASTLLAPLRATLETFGAIITEISQPAIPTLDVVRGWHERMAVILGKADQDNDLARTYKMVFETVLERKATVLMAESQRHEPVLERLYRLRLIQVIRPDHVGLVSAIDNLKQEGGTQAFQDAIAQANRDYRTGNTIQQRRALDTYRHLLQLCARDDWTGEFLRIIKPWAESEAQ